MEDEDARYWISNSDGEHVAVRPKGRLGATGLLLLQVHLRPRPVTGRSAEGGDSNYGSLLQRAGRTPLLSDRTYTLTYKVDNQEPETFYKSFASTDFDSAMPDCTSDNPLYPRSCSTEAQAMQSSWESGVYRPKECNVGTPALAGSYVNPYVYATEAPLNGRRYGAFHFETIRGGGITTPGDTFRRADYQIDCGGNSKTWFFTIDQKIVYLCPLGFKGTSVGFTAAKPPIEGTRWCVPMDPLPSIKVTLRQYDSCPVNAHPCFPGTGDKMRLEPDFQISGWTFARVYHSLAELDSGNISTGWSTTFSDRVIAGVLPAYVTPDGFYEGSVSAGGSRYRSLVHQERVIEKIGSPLIGYRVTYGSEIREFDVDGRLVLLRDANDAGRNVTVSYAGDNVSQLLTAQGRRTMFEYEAGRLSRIVRPDGSAIEYAYDAAENLSAVRQAGGVKQYIYNESGRSGSDKTHLLTGIIDETGHRYATFSYDGDGRVTGSQLEGDDGPVEATRVTYTGADTVQVSTDGLGTRTITYASNQYRRPLTLSDVRGTVSNTYSSAQLIRNVDRTGNTTTYAYEGGFLSSVETAASTQSWRKVFYTRDALGRETKREIRGSETGSSLAVLSTVKHGYLASGARFATCEVDPAVSGASAYVCGAQTPAPAGVRQTLLTYCADADVQMGVCPLTGLVVAIDGPRSDVVDTTKFQYYPSDHPDCAVRIADCLWRKGDLWKVMNAAGQVSETLRYDAMGRAASLRDANGVTTDFIYDFHGRLTSSVVAGGGTPDQTTRIDYYPNGLVSSITLPDGSFTSYAYDGAHRLAAVVDADGNAIHYTLDAAGKRIGEDVRDEHGTLRRTMSRTYDAFGRLNAVTDATGNRALFSYDANGNLNRATDALGRVTKREYDARGQVLSVTEDADGIGATTGVVRNANDAIREVVDPNGLRTLYQYNAFGELVRLSSPDTGQTNYAYDSAGNPLSTKDARDETTAFKHDALNRLISTTFSDARLNMAYDYDVAPSDCDPFESFPAGRLARMTDASGETRYCNDRFGNVTRKVQQIGELAFTVQYAYTSAGRLSSLQYPDGMRVDYVRDAAGRTTEIGLTQAGGDRQVLVTNVSHHPFGNVAGWTFAGGRTITRTVDLNYRPSTISSAAPGQPGSQYAYGWDAAGNLTSLGANQTPGSAAIEFAYDGLNRLTEFKDKVTGAVIEGYTYDATGNRTTVSNAIGVQTYRYAPASHRLLSVGDVDRRYDAAGNTVFIGQDNVAFQYNAAGRMSRAERGTGSVVEYIYNGHGERVCRGLADTRIYSIFDEDGRWLGDFDGEAAVQLVVWMDDLPVSVIAQGKVHFIETDHLGTPRAVIDTYRNVPIWTWDMAGEAFGNSAPDEDPDRDGTAFTFDMRFPGQRYDSATGLNHNYFRDYDFGIGRYVQSDPLGLAAGPSTYGYANGMPTGAYDPFGLKAIRQPSTPPKRGEKGSIRCEGGSVVPYVRWGALDSYQKECLGDCLLAHERSHAADANRADPGICRYYSWLGGIGPLGDVTFDTMEELRATELAAHRVELQCLKSKRSPLSCDNDVCRNVIQDRINQIEQIFIPRVENGTYWD